MKDGKVKILVVDDDYDDYILIAEALTKRIDNIDIRNEENGNTALKYLKGMKARPDLIVLDVNMPVMDGRQTLVKLQEDKELKSIPVVVLTTSDSDVDKKFFEKKNIEMLVKPWNSKEIQQTAEKLLHLVRK